VKTKQLLSPDMLHTVAYFEFRKGGNIRGLGVVLCRFWNRNQNGGFNQKPNRNRNLQILQAN